MRPGMLTGLGVPAGLGGASAIGAVLASSGSHGFALGLGIAVLIVVCLRTIGGSDK